MQPLRKGKDWKRVASPKPNLGIVSNRPRHKSKDNLDMSLSSSVTSKNNAQHALRKYKSVLESHISDKDKNGHGKAASNVRVKNLNTEPDLAGKGSISLATMKPKATRNGTTRSSGL